MKTKRPIKPNKIITQSKTKTKSKSESKTKSKTKTTSNAIIPSKSNNKKSNNGYEWGLGIEHEFIPVIPIKDFEEYKHIYSILNNKKLDDNNINVKNLQKEMVQIKNTFYMNIPIYYPDNYLSEHFPFSNMEWTGSKGFWMLETKNMNYKNVSLDTLLTEINKNTRTILDDYNKILAEHFKEQIKTQVKLPRFDEPNEGSIFYLYNKENTRENYWNAPKPKVLYEPEQPTHLAIDTAGSYHFWITLPHRVNDNYKSLHQRAAYLLQSIEPLLIGTYCSPDPRITTKNKKYLFAGSFRGAVNNFANYGTSLLQDYNNQLIFNRQMSIKDITMPGNIDSEHYIFQIRKRYSNNKTKKNSANNDIVYNDELVRQKPTIKPKYMFLEDKLEKPNFFNRPFFYNHSDSDEDKLKRVSIGLNIRRTEGVKGFEFRIMDHLPEHMLKNLSKVIYLCACMSYEISGDDLILAATNKGWNTMIASSLFNGYKAKPEAGYITFLENQFKIDLHFTKQPKNTIELLEYLVDKCWEKIMKNKNNGLWLMLGDDKTKPKIESKNKEILDKLL